MYQRLTWPIRRRTTIYEAGGLRLADTFRMPEKQKAMVRQLPVKPGPKCFLRRVIEIDDYISAENCVHRLSHGPVCKQIEFVECDKRFQI